MPTERMARTLALTALLETNSMFLAEATTTESKSTESIRSCYHSKSRDETTQTVTRPNLEFLCARGVTIGGLTSRGFGEIFWGAGCSDFSQTRQDQPNLQSTGNVILSVARAFFCYERITRYHLPADIARSRETRRAVVAVLDKRHRAAWKRQADVCRPLVAYFMRRMNMLVIARLRCLGVAGRAFCHGQP